LEAVEARMFVYDEMRFVSALCPIDFWEENYDVFED
jgi:hypothetical protein